MARAGAGFDAVLLGACGLALTLSLAMLLPLAAHASGPTPPGFVLQPWKGSRPVPMLPLQDLDGTPWRLADQRGRAVLLNFWASWCEPCRAEMPALQQLADTHRGGLMVLTINLKESEASVRQFVQRTGLRLPVVRDADGALARAWGVSVYPSTALIDARGRVQAVVVGEVDWMGPDGQRLLRPLQAD